MEENWESGLDFAASMTAKPTKRVVSSQPAKNPSPSNSTPIKSSSHLKVESSTPIKIQMLSEHSTTYSKHSELKQMLTSQRRTDELHKKLTPTKSPIPNSSKYTPQHPSKPLFRQSLFTQTPSFETKKSEKFVNSNSSVSSPIKTRSSLLTSNTRQAERSDKPRASYDPRTQRQRIFENSFEFTESHQVLRTVTQVKRNDSDMNAPCFVDRLPPPAVMKQEELRTLVVTPSPEKVELYEITLQNVPKTYSEFSVREILVGFHLVAVMLETDNITGECKGSGKIMVRTNYCQDVKGICVSLGKVGVVANVNLETKGRRNDFSEFFSENWQVRREQAQSSPGKAREAKLKGLQSSIFS